MTSKRGERCANRRASSISSVLAIAAVASFFSAACSSNANDGGGTSNVGVDVNSGALSLTFDHAAQSTGVPRDLLLAIARVEDGLELPAQRTVLEIDNAVPAAGPLMLRRGKLDTLARAAVLSGKTELELRQNSDLALDAGARVLAELGTKSGARAEDLASWKAAIEDMSGYADDAHREEYAHRVFATLARGGVFDGRDGEKLSLGQHDLPPTLTLDISEALHTLTTAQFAGAQWIPTSCNNKCTIGRAGNPVQYVVIHDTEGGWDASVATLQNDPGKSVQYIVGTDGKVAQFVTEETTAWHAGNFYYNQRSVGIEHVGYASKPYTEAEYAASAKLVSYLAKKYGITPDRSHIIGHQQIPNGTKIAESAGPCVTSPSACAGNVDFGGADHHTDPGDWEWATYMPRIGGAAKCNDATTLWNCSYDLKKAFRCNAGKVAVETCDGTNACEVKPSGQDDVCNMGTKPTSTPPSTSTPADPGNVNVSPGDMAGVAQTTGAPVAGDDVSAPPAASDQGGCSVSHASGSGSASGFGLLALVGMIAALGTRRRRAA